MVKALNEYQKTMLDNLNKLEQILQDMPAEELRRLFEESKVTEEEANQYAILEKMIMRQDRMSYLERIGIIADFKTAKNAFIREGVSPIAIETLFRKFEKAKDQNKITKPDEKNIDYWAKKPWSDFSSFLEELESTLSRGEEKREPWKSTAEGTKKVAENKDWVIFRILSFEGAKALGTRNWCIVRDRITYRNFVEGREEKPVTFYFALSKTQSYKIKRAGTPLEYEDPRHRIAIGVTLECRVSIDAEGITCWDAHDEKVDISGLDLPHVKWESEDACTCGRGKNFCKCE